MVVLPEMSEMSRIDVSDILPLPNTGVNALFPFLTFLTQWWFYGLSGVFGHLGLIGGFDDSPRGRAVIPDVINR